MQLVLNMLCRYFIRALVRSCATPLGTSRREGNCIYIYVCPFFVLLTTFPFVRALFGETVSTRTRKTGPDTLVEVSARSVHFEARGGRSIFFSPAGVHKTISLVSVREALCCTEYVRTARLKFGHLFGLSCDVYTRYVPVPFFLRPNTTQTTDYSRAESAVNPSGLQGYNPAVQQQQHSGQPRARVAQVYMRVGLRCTAVVI